MNKTDNKLFTVVWVAPFGHIQRDALFTDTAQAAVNAVREARGDDINIQYVDCRCSTSNWS